MDFSDRNTSRRQKALAAGQMVTDLIMDAASAADRARALPELGEIYWTLTQTAAASINRWVTTANKYVG